MQWIKVSLNTGAELVFQAKEFTMKKNSYSKTMEWETSNGWRDKLLTCDPDAVVAVTVHRRKPKVRR